MSNAKYIAIFSTIWGLERFSLTLFNLCIATFLTGIGEGSGLVVIGTIYIVVQVVPLAVLALYSGVWLDQVDRYKAVVRTLAVKTGGVALTLAFSTCLTALHMHVGIIMIIPMMIFLVLVSAITNSMHIILRLAVERVWVVLASQKDNNSSSFLTRCNSAMSMSSDVGQLLAILLFSPLTQDVGESAVFLISGGTILLATVVQYVGFTRLESKALPPQIQCLNGQDRNLKSAFVEYLSQKDAPVGICWAARSTFTAVWFAASVMEHSPIGVLYRWFYYTTTIATSLSYMCTVPRLKQHIILYMVAGCEIVAVVMAAVPVLATRIQDYSLFGNTSLIDATENAAQATTSITLARIAPQVYTLAIYVLLALALVMSAACHRTWNLTALQLYQERVPARKRGAVGGVQIFLDYVCLSLHGLLAIATTGKGYIWSCALIGLLLSSFNLCVLLWWRMVRRGDSETVTLLRRDMAESRGDQAL